MIRLGTNAYQIGREILKDFQKFAQQDLPKATVKGLTDAAEGCKLGLRAQMTAAGLGNKLPKTWQTKTRHRGLLVFPQGKVSLNAAALVVNTAPHIIAGYDRATIVRAKSGTYLAIPTDNCPPGPRGRRLTPSTWPEGRFGELHFAHGPHGTAFLFIRAISRFDRVSGDFKGYRKATKARLRKDAAEIVVMFTLVKQSATKKVIDPEREALKWLARVNDLISKELARGNQS